MENAVRVIDAWQEVLVKGQPDQLDGFLDEVARRFQALSWSREPALEGKMNGDSHQLHRFFCWVGGPAGGPRVMLCLNRVTPRRIRGNMCYLVDDPTGAGLIGMASVVEHVLSNILEPAATAVGLKTTYPRLGPISRVGPRTAKAMMALAEAADGQWPLPDNLEPAWRKFVIAAQREDVAFDPDELIGWFAANGWDDRASAELIRRFFADAALLSEYDEEERPA